MEEKILSGYCRSIDSHRTVIAEKENGRWQADCSYDGCPFSAQCPVVQPLEQKQ